MTRRLEQMRSRGHSLEQWPNWDDTCSPRALTIVLHHGLYNVENHLSTKTIYSDKIYLTRMRTHGRYKYSTTIGLDLYVSSDYHVSQKKMCGYHKWGKPPNKRTPLTCQTIMMFRKTDNRPAWVVYFAYTYWNLLNYPIPHRYPFL